MKKPDRQIIYDKCSGHCAYCGCEISIAKMHVDHIHPKYRGGTDEMDNLNPACRVCNQWKKTYTVEEFRREIGHQAIRVAVSSPGFRLMCKYGLVTIEDCAAQFYFERMAI